MFLGTFLLCDVVYAKDGGMPPNFAQAKVHITVTDENDNAPTFGKLQYRLELPENLDPVKIFIIKATDHDSGDSGRVEYRVTGKYNSYMITVYTIPHLGNKLHDHHLNKGFLLRVDSHLFIKPFKVPFCSS